MVDIHSHILPDVDDGSGSMEESVNMARLAVDSGVDAIVATPHFRGIPVELEKISLIVNQGNRLVRELVRENIPLELYPGAEILCLPETPLLGARGALPTLGNTRYLLTEFYFDESGDTMDDILSRLAGQGYSPVVAHPERYRAVARDPRLVRRWFDRGYVLQLNKGSVGGAFGERAQRTALGMLRSGMAHLFASDAHGADYRTPHMGAIRQWAEKNLDQDYARILLEENPRRVIAGQPMVPVE